MRWAAYDALAELPDPPPAAPWSLAVYRFRYPVAAASCLAVLLGVGSAAWALYQVGAPRVLALRQAMASTNLPEPPPSPVAMSPPRQETGALIPSPRLAPSPASIWLVEKRSDGELWSNGLRIFTTFETRTVPRRYLLFPRPGGAPIRVEERPAGILFHTTENDMAPFEPDFNRSILRTTESLLRYLAKRSLYNYVIDRFGRVYRLVTDSDVATHAGFSVWADDAYIYLNLNESFIGVSFESQWSPTPSEVQLLTAPQLQSGLNLTDMLRAHYGLEDVNCTTHGLVSVNPTKMLIGHHRDWAKGFPFPDFRLTDKYATPLPSVLELGFRYDEHFVGEMKGDLWPGLEKASIEFGKRAAARGVSLERLQEELRRAYRERLDLLTAADSATIKDDAGARTLRRVRSELPAARGKD